MNKQVAIYLFLALSLGTLILSLVARYGRDFSSPENKPKELTSIRIKSKKLDLGKLPVNNKAKTDFFIYNVGSENLYIDNVEVSCSCSSSTVTNKSIAAGDSVPVTLMYNKKIPGYFYTDVLIHGNFKTSPEIMSFEGYLIDQKSK